MAVSYTHLDVYKRQMLHTTFVNRSEDLGPNGACTPATCPTSVPNLKKAAEAVKAAAEANS